MSAPAYTYRDLDADTALVREAFEMLQTELQRDAEDDSVAFSALDDVEAARDAFERIRRELGKIAHA